MSKKVVAVAALAVLAVGAITGSLIARLQHPSEIPSIPTIAVLPSLMPTSDSAPTTAATPALPAAALPGASPTTPPTPAETLPPSQAPSVEPPASASPLPASRSIVLPDTVLPAQPSTVTAAPLSQPSVQVALNPQPLPGQVVIRFAEAAPPEARQAYLESIGAEVAEEITALDTVVVNVARDADELPPSPAVAAAEPDYIASALIDVPTSDPHYAEQWSLPVIGAPEAWAALPADPSGVVVAVIDSGVCLNHPDLQGQFLPGYDFVDDDAQPQDAFGHGCGVSGIIAARIDNSEGIAGVAPDTQILPVRVLDASGNGAYSDVAAGIVYAVDNGAQIINLSLGGAAESQTLKNAVDYALARGVTLIAAAGNTGREGILYPARYEGVIAVGSIDSSLERSSFSTYGPELDLLAPGRDILTTTRDGYGRMSGTSFAAPHAAGIAALEQMRGRSLAYDGGLAYVTAVEPMATGVPQPDELPDDAVLIEGDILMPANYNQLGAQSAFTSNLWPGGIVPYAFDSNVTEAFQIRAAEAAMAVWENAARVDFVPRTSQSNYVYIKNCSGNWSWIGMIGNGKQDLCIYNWSMRYVIVHELGHALALYHEQSRPDRDNYVQINWSNIAEANRGNFNKHTDAGTHGPYDFDSVMHYGQYTFGINPSVPTIIVLPPNEAWQDDIGQFDHLSEWDAAGMAVLYGSRSSLANDEASGAVEVTSLPYTAMLDTSGATGSPGDPVMACTGQRHEDTVWYRFNPGFTGTALIDTTGSSYDTVLTLWKGTPDSLTHVACDNNGTGQASVAATVRFGESYYIEVGSASGVSGTLQLNVSDSIFSDGFESGGLSAWTGSRQDGVDLNVIPMRRLGGNYVLRAILEDNTPIYLTDGRPNAETQYRAGFYFDPNSVVMAQGDNHHIFIGYQKPGGPIFRVQLRYASGYQLRLASKNDSGTWVFSTWVPISDAPHFIELDWRSGLASGSMTMWLDGSQQAGITGLANGNIRVDTVRLGAVAGIDTGTRGRVFFDSFVSRRYGYFGPSALASATGVDEPAPEAEMTGAFIELPMETATATLTATATVTATPEMALIAVEAESEYVLRDGEWLRFDLPDASGGAYQINTGLSDTLRLQFNGSRVEIASIAAPSFGAFEVEIDGALYQTVNAAEGDGLTRLVIEGLSEGEHTLTVRPLESVIGIDAFYVVAPVMPVPTIMPTAETTVESTPILPTLAPVNPDEGGGVNEPTATDTVVTLEPPAPTATETPAPTATETPLPTVEPELPPTVTPESTEAAPPLPEAEATENAEN